MTTNSPKSLTELPTDEKLSRSLEKIQRSITPLHALLDLLQRPISKEEGETVERLFDLMVAMRAELQASRKALIAQRNTTTTLNEEMRALRAEVKSMHRLIAHMHRVLRMAPNDL